MSGIRNDRIGQIVNEDSFFYKVLHRKTMSSGWKAEKARDQLRKRLRIGARLLLSCREFKKDIFFWELLQPKFFDLLVAGTRALITRTKNDKTVKKEDKSDTEEKGPEISGLPDRGVKVGHFINLSIGIKKAEAHKKSDEEVERNMTRLEDLMKIEWADSISGECKQLIKERTRPEKLELPTTADVVKINEGLERKLREILHKFTAKKSAENYRNLQKTLLCQTIVHNRKRGTEVSTARIADWNSAQKVRASHTEEMIASLTPDQQELAKENCLMTVIGRVWLYKLKF